MVKLSDLSWSRAIMWRRRHFSLSESPPPLTAWSVIQNTKYIILNTQIHYSQFPNTPFSISKYTITLFQIQYPNSVSQSLRRCSQLDPSLFRHHQRSKIPNTPCSNSKCTIPDLQIHISLIPIAPSQLSRRSQPGP